MPARAGCLGLVRPVGSECALLRSSFSCPRGFSDVMCRGRAHTRTGTTGGLPATRFAARTTSASPRNAETLPRAGPYAPPIPGRRKAANPQTVKCNSLMVYGSGMRSVARKTRSTIDTFDAWRFLQESGVFRDANEEATMPRGLIDDLRLSIDDYPLASLGKPRLSQQSRRSWNADFRLSIANGDLPAILDFVAAAGSDVRMLSRKRKAHVVGRTQRLRRNRDW